MKKIIFVFKILLLIFSTSCHAQKLVHKQADTRLLIENKSSFINKPLSVLLEQINVPIKAYYGSRTISPGGALVFLFEPYDSVITWANRGKRAIRIRVTIKEPFESDNLNRPIKERYLWLKEDEEKYNNLRIANIAFSGMPTD